MRTTTDTPPAQDDGAPCDLLLVGGGLQNGLIALGALRERPDLRLTLVERNRRLGGSHTWSLFDSDVDERVMTWLEPLFEARWPRYEVAFPTLRRVVEAGYASLTGAGLDAALREAFAARDDCTLLTRAEVVAIGRGDAAGDAATAWVDLADGRRLRARMIVDAPGPAPRAGQCGYQVFYGLELALAEDIDLAHPLVFDAALPDRPPQDAGFRFVYALPLGPRRVLVEDTCYADRPTLDRPRLRADALAWAERRGWRVDAVVREEEGALPIPWTGALAHLDGPVLRGGYAGGWFHPTTGYSLPVAARLATWLLDQPTLPPSPRSLDDLHRALTRQQRFCRWLNWMLFRATPPANRWRLFERTYRYSDARVARFYRLGMTWTDQLAFLFARLPRGISMSRMLRALAQRPIQPPVAGR